MTFPWKDHGGCFLSHVFLEALGVPSRARVCFLSHRNWRASGTTARNAILRQPRLLAAEATFQKATQQLLEWISAHSPWEPATMLWESSDDTEATWSRTRLRNQLVSTSPGWWVSGLQVSQPSTLTPSGTERSCPCRAPLTLGTQEPNESVNWWGGLSHHHGNRIKA